MATKKILVIGGKGQIGKKILNLNKDKFEFIIFDKKDNFFKKNNFFISGDCFKKKDLKKIPINIDIVIFLVGFKGGPKSLDIKFYKFFFKYNCQSLISFLKNNNISKFKKIIFFSTEHVYGDNFKYQTEIMRNEPLPKNFYGSTKLLSEKILFNYWKKYRISIDIMRIPRVISKNENNLISKIIKDTERKKIIKINTKNSFNFIYIDDLLSALNKSILQMKMQFRILNIFNNSKGHSIKEITKIIENIQKSRIRTKYQIKKNFRDHNPINLKISNTVTKKRLKWKPLFSTKKIIKELI